MRLKPNEGSGMPQGFTLKFLKAKCGKKPVIMAVGWWTSRLLITLFSLLFYCEQITGFIFNALNHLT